ncbi:hypothetical protein BVC80_1601g75 [Macleaya cordata]|uniref:Uncharacterized protein n=1 Tax=Macleaya cordata TaxID=56857 RepID=A0A200QA02_MACCD|nr:hypothetical protein BVC80_1601g75 [Macleaya cordata]
MATIRRTRWYPPPPPSPRILHLPRRARRKTTKNIPGKSVLLKESECSRRINHRGKLETLFDQERVFSRTVPIVLLNNESSGDYDRDCERRERVEEDFEFGEKFEDEKWRFQTEILRAECNFLRMEREIALRKLEMNQVQTKKTLRSAVETLISGKKKIYEGKSSVGAVLEEIEDLEEKLDELQRKSGVTEIEIRKCNNFDKKASVLRRRLEKLGFEEKCVKEIQEMAEASLTIKTTSSIYKKKFDKLKQVEILGRKMEGLSKGMLERMEEEYRSMLCSSSSSSATASATSSASTSSRFEFPPHSSSSSSTSFERMFHEEKVCSGRCKSIVRKIVEQVRSEMEQWSQMQEMLGRVREEMEELHASRDFWEDRALNADTRVQSLQSAVEEWKQKALVSDTKVSELQKQISELHIELRRSRTERNIDSSRTKNIGMTPWDLLQKEKEKRVLICSLKENHQANSNKQSKDYSDIGRTKEHALRYGFMGSNRSPLREIENSSPQLVRQIGRTTVSPPLHNSENHHANSNKQNKDYSDTGRNKERTIERAFLSSIMVSNRSPLREIENSSSLLVQKIGRTTVSPLHSSEKHQANANKQNKDYSGIGKTKECTIERAFRSGIRGLN